MKNEMMITLAELTTMMKNEKTFKGGNLMGYDMITDVKLTGGKKNPMQGRVQKVHNNFLVFLFNNKTRSSYQTMVNKRKVEQGGVADFVASQLPWGTRVPNTACIENKGTDYLQTIQFQTAKSVTAFAEELGIQLTDKDVELIGQMSRTVVDYNTPFGKCHYLLDGKKIDKKDIIGLKQSTSEGKQGGLEDNMKVIVRTPKLKGYTRVTLNGTTYRIVD